MNEPTDVLTRFLHDLFGKYSHPMDVAELRWKAIRQDHPPYATAAVVSLEHVLRTCNDPQFLSDLVRIDAGLMTVEDGKLWLGALSVALQTEDFGSLPESVGSRPYGVEVGRKRLGHYSAGTPNIV